MDHDHFVGQVQHRARLDSTGRAERAIRATLETLAERIPGGTAQNVAAQLPPEIGEHLRRRAGGDLETGERFSLDEFFDRVVERESVDRPAAVHHARVVLEVVDEATTGGLVQRVRDSLPDEFAPLFDSGSTGSWASSN